MPAAPSHRWIPWAFVGGLAIVVVANGALAYFAATSTTGLVTEHPFQRGKGYNRVLAAAAAQDALGWRGTARFVEQASGRGEIAVAISDAADRPLSGLAVTALIARPIEPLPERRIDLAETTGGRYAAEVTLDRPGQWELHVAARRGGDRFEFAQRIIVK